MFCTKQVLRMTLSAPLAGLVQFVSGNTNGCATTVGGQGRPKRLDQLVGSYQDRVIKEIRIV